MLVRYAIAILTLSIATLSGACSGDDTVAPTTGDSSLMEAECEDNDGDGYGPFCDNGRDCNDDDDAITDLCYRCAEASPDCPCETGTEGIWCDPPDKKTEQDGKTGLIVCSEGNMYCRPDANGDSYWGECEIIADFATFVPDD